MLRYLQTGRKILNSRVSSKHEVVVSGCVLGRWLAAAGRADVSRLVRLSLLILGIAVIGWLTVEFDDTSLRDAATFPGFW